MNDLNVSSFTFSTGPADDVCRLCEPKGVVIAVVLRGTIYRNCHRHRRDTEHCARKHHRPVERRVVCLTHGGRRKTPFALNAAIRRWRKFVGTFVNQMRFGTAPRSAASRCPVAALAFAGPLTKNISLYVR